MKMIAHQTKAQHTDIKTEDRYRNIIHPCNKILTTSENVVSFQPVAAYMIVPFHSFFSTIYVRLTYASLTLKKDSEDFSFFIITIIR